MSEDLYYRISLPPNPKPTEIVQPKTYSGFSTVNSTAENFNLYDFELIKQDITNHFHVRQGERLMQPMFGTIIWDVLFEPLTEELKAIILQDVKRIINYDPRVEIYDASVGVYDTGITIEYVLQYKPYNISEQIKMQFDQDNGLI